MTSPNSQRWFWLGCGFELLLGLVGAVASSLLGRPLPGDLRWSWSAALWGLAAVVPLMALFVWTLNAGDLLLRSVRLFLERSAMPLFRQWSLWQLAAISLVAGFGEETLFRHAIQGALTAPLGAAAAVLVGGLLFGLCHFVNHAYGLIATLVGVYLGALWLLTGNLLAPITAHAVYDFVALVYFVRWHRVEPPAPDPAQPEA